MTYWLNEDSRTFLSRGYLKPNQSAEDRIKEIATHVERIIGEEGLKEKVEEIILNGWVSLASPVWSNFGSTKALPISCNNSFFDDDMDDILAKVAEIGKQTKMGAGTSAYFGKIRPRGSPISAGGHADGPVHFMGLVDSTVNIVSQSNVRRGNCAVYLDVDHPDILEFLECREEGHPIQHLSLGVCITDQWMEEMLDGDKEKRKIWARIIKKRFETGYPYIFWTDNVNNNAPDVYKDKNRRIYSSNLCLTGDQRVVTSKGYLTAKELYDSGEPLTLFDGNKIVKSSPMLKRGDSQKILKIVLDNGMEQRLTENHQVVLMDDFGKTTKISAKDVRVGDNFAIQINKGIFGDVHMPKEAFLLGLYHGDGTTTPDNRVCLDLWKNDFDLIDEIQETVNMIYRNEMDSYYHRAYPVPHFTKQTTRYNVDKKRLSTKLLRYLGFEKNVIPQWIWEGDEETIWSYIRGLLYSDGTVHISSSGGNPIQINISNINRDFLKNIQLLLNNLGMQSSIRLLRKGKPTQFRSDQKFYQSKDCYRIVIGNKNDALVLEEKTKFLSRKGIYIEDREYRNNTKKRYEVVSIEFDGYEDVYCPTVYSNENNFVSQGIITGNCSEILLSSTIDESFVCCLSSMNLLHYYDWKGTHAVSTMVKLLDAVMTDYINKTKGMKHMETARNFAKRQRAIGLGVLGYHSFLQSQNIPFESEEARALNEEIHEYISTESLNTSKEMAITHGEPELLVGYGRRHTTLMAIAPTASSAFILGQVSPSIEPLNSNYFQNDTAKGTFTYKNPFLIKLLELKEKNTEEVWKSILVNGGSVQHLDFLSQHEKDVFKTFDEINQWEIIVQAYERQKFIDQSQSLNIKVHPDAPAKDVSDLTIEAWRLGIKTMYYQHSTSKAQAFVRELLSCSACEA